MHASVFVRVNHFQTETRRFQEAKSALNQTGAENINDNLSHLLGNWENPLRTEPGQRDILVSQSGSMGGSRLGELIYKLRNCTIAISYRYNRNAYSVMSMFARVKHLSNANATFPGSKRWLLRSNVRLVCM